MPNPIKIVIDAQTEAAAAALRDFVRNGAAQIDILNRGTAAAGAALGDGISKNAFKARMGLMELEHTARSTFDILLMGGSPRMLLAQIPQMLQSAQLMGFSMTTMLTTVLPIVGAVGAAVGAGVLALKAFGEAEADIADQTKKLADNFKELPGLLKQIADALKAGLISPAAAQQMVGQLTDGKTRYLDENGNLTEQASRREYHEAYTIPGGQFSPAKYVPAGYEDIPNQPATFDQIVAKQKDRLTAGGNLAPEQIAGLSRIQSGESALEKMGLSPSEREVQETKDQYAKVIGDLQQDIQMVSAKMPADQKKSFLAKLMGVDPANMGDVEVLTQKAIADINNKIAQAQIQEQNKIADIRQKAQEAAAQKSAEAENKIRMANAKEFADANKGIESQITMQAAEEGKKREDFYQQEYIARVTAANTFFAEGKIDAEQYGEAIDSAYTQFLTSLKAVNEELDRQRRLQLENQRDKAQSQLAGIEQNPFLSEQAKAQQSIPYLQQQLAAQKELDLQKGITEETREQAELKNQIAAANGQNSFTYNLGIAVTQLQSMNNLAKETAATFQNAFNTAISSISHNLTGVIMGTETWRQALLNIGETILGTVVEAIIEMGVRWVLTQLMMDIFGKAMQAAALAALVPIAAAQSAIWATPATLATIASFGGAAAAAPAEIGGAIATTLGLAAFEQGGRPTPGQLALVGERGPELFVPDVAGTILPAHITAAALRGGGNGSPVSTGRGGGKNSPAPVHKVVIAWNQQQLKNELKKGDYAEVTVHHINNNRQKVGIQT